MKTLLSYFSGLVLLVSCLAPTGSAQAQTISPGTEIQVQLLDRLDTGETQAGQEFSATLAEPVNLEEGMVWPKGTEVKGKVVDVVSSGRLSRPASITLQLTQIGNSTVQTQVEQIDGKSHAGRNAALIGGTAAVGAILGSIAGGGKGALIGTVAGAGAGTVTAAATGKQEIVLSPETTLAFVVADPSAAEPAAAPPVAQSPEAAPPPDQYADQYPDQNQYPDQYPDSQYYAPYSPEQLDNLLAPVALYPDPLLAQVLLAATFPDQVQDAASWVRRHDPNSVDYRPWDVSVKAVAHYPTVLDMLNDRMDWTTALGQAYAYQSTDVMMSVQRLRNLAYSHGNLVSTPQQRVVWDGGYIQIVPAQARYIFVPVYDPGVIYVRRVYRPGFGFGGFYSFGRGFVIGAWLNYDLDWHYRRVVYDGWDARHSGWRQRSRPYVHVTNVYINTRYEHVSVNRRVVERHVDYNNVRRYNSVHREVTYENRERAESRRLRNEPRHVGPPPRPVNERRNDRDDQRGVRSQPAPALERRPQRPQDARFKRTNQPRPAVEQSRPQPASERIDNRGDDRNMRSRPVFQGRPQRGQDTPVERTNQAPPAVEQSRPQPANVRTNDRGNQREIRNEPPNRPEQPARIVSGPAPKAAAAAAPPSATPAKQAGPQQRQQAKRGRGTEKQSNKSKDKDEDKK
jgi:hypothetical protein